MTATTDKPTDNHHKSMETGMRLYQLSIDSSQRIMALQTGLAKELIQSGVDYARVQSASKDPQEVIRLRAEFSQEMARNIIAASRQIAEIGNETRAELSHMLIEQLTFGNTDLADAMQAFANTLPISSESLAAVMEKSAASSKK